MKPHSNHDLSEWHDDCSRCTTEMTLVVVGGVLIILALVGLIRWWW